MLQYVRDLTGRQQMLYVGHSMGTTAFWVMMNRHPEMNSVISLMVGMAPVAASTNMASPIKYIAPVADQVERMLTMAGQYEFAPRGSLISDISETLCSQVNQTVPRNESACHITENLIFSLSGFDAPQMNFVMLHYITILYITYYCSSRPCYLLSVATPLQGPPPGLSFTLPRG